VSLTLTACGEVRAATSEERDAAPSANTCAESVYLKGIVVNGDAGKPLLASDEAHPCSWPRPARAANEDESKRRLVGYQGPDAELNMIEVGDAAGCDPQRWQYYETSGTEPQYVLCPDTCASFANHAPGLNLWRTCS
jgi:hypothetical protein